MKTSLKLFRLCASAIILFLMAFTSPSYGQSVRIDEFMANNQLTHMDEDGDFSDWIEIYNPTSASVSLNGWSLSDEKEIPQKWVFPDVTIAANSYLLVFASGKDKKPVNGELHTNFKLSKNGEYLALLNNGTVVTQFDPEYPEQETDKSYGLYNDAYVILNTSSPGTATPSSVATILPPPGFSKPHGFYNETFTLEITNPVTSAQTIYTTDGTQPGLMNGQTYTQPIEINTTSIIRAVSYKDGQELSKVTTQSFLFLDDVLKQPNDPTGYPAEWGKYTDLVGSAKADYEMDPEMLSDTAFANAVKDALMDIPTISLVTNKDHFFNNLEDAETGGIYMFTGAPISDYVDGKGSGWERPVSFEYFDGNTISLQVDCGVRLQGGHSRRAEKSPKHSFRLVFKSKYGSSKLSYPFFGEEGPSSFNNLTLRAGFCNTWIHHTYDQRNRSQYLRDSWAKDIQKAMGYPAVNNNFAHLYINGMYWGLYNPSERIDDDFAADHFGGDKDDYDVIKDYNEVISGTKDAWTELNAQVNTGLTSAEAYQKLLGNNADGTPNGEYENLLDVENFIDYMIINYYGGNTDWDHHNWAAVRNRKNPGRGFKFICWDSEHVLKDIHENVLYNNNSNRPSHIFQGLMQNQEFRNLFADRVSLHCLNNGILTPEKSSAVWMVRAKEIELAVDAEAARWGDYRKDVHNFQTVGPFALYTKETHWIPQLEFMKNTYFPQRTGIFLDQLRSEGLYSNIEPPVCKIINNPINPKTIQKNDTLSITSAEGVIYFTTDGSDPVTWTSNERVPLIDIINGDAAKDVLVPKEDIGTDWLMDMNYDVSSWGKCTGQPGAIGYEKENGYQGFITYNVGNDMHESGTNPNNSCYVRVKFSLTQDEINNFGMLFLPIAFDNGFAAYINGEMVAQSNVTLPLSWNASNTGDHEVERVEMYNASSIIEKLKVGENLLAIHGVNSSISSPDFLLYFGLYGIGKGDSGDPSPKAEIYTEPIALNTSSHIKTRILVNGQWSPLTEHYYVVPDELKNLKITEVNYHPITSERDTIDEDKYEFVEIKNTGSSTLNLAGLKFDKGIKYEFGPFSEIGPGEFIVLAGSGRAFYKRYNMVPYDEYSGKLDNDGERIMLLTETGDTICNFKYNDNAEWPQGTDGDSTTLVPTQFNPENNQDSAIYWRASYELGGSPGADDVKGIKYMEKPVDQDPIGIEPIIIAENNITLLHQNFPNPFTEFTNIGYQLTEHAHVQLSVYNLMGQKVAILLDAEEIPGQKLVTWYGTSNNNLAVKKGIYFYELKVTTKNDKKVFIKKMMKTQ